MKEIVIVESVERLKPVLTKEGKRVLVLVSIMVVETILEALKNLQEDLE